MAEFLDEEIIRQYAEIVKPRRHIMIVEIDRGPNKKPAYDVAVVDILFTANADFLYGTVSSKTDVVRWTRLLKRVFRVPKHTYNIKLATRKDK